MSQVCLNYIIQLSIYYFFRDIVIFFDYQIFNNHYWLGISCQFIIRITTYTRIFKLILSKTLQSF